MRSYGTRRVGCYDDVLAETWATLLRVKPHILRQQEANFSGDSITTVRLVLRIHTAFWYSQRRETSNKKQPGTRRSNQSGRKTILNFIFPFRSSVREDWFIIAVLAFQERGVSTSENAHEPPTHGQRGVISSEDARLQPGEGRRPWFSLLPNRIGLTPPPCRLLRGRPWPPYFFS